MTDEQRKQLSRELDQEAERAAIRIRENFRATQPQPCTSFRYAGTAGWVAKLNEEVYEAMLESAYVERLAAEADDDDVACLAEELTDVITVCVSWLNALGYDETMRGELHRMYAKAITTFHDGHSEMGEGALCCNRKICEKCAVEVNPGIHFCLRCVRELKSKLANIPL